MKSMKHLPVNVCTQLKVVIFQEKKSILMGCYCLGSPFGCTGARQYATILRLLKPGEFGVTSMCIGTGIGAASVLVRE